MGDGEGPTSALYHIILRYHHYLHTLGPILFGGFYSRAYSKYFLFLDFDDCSTGLGAI
jgi:hypothetical protein